NERYRREPTPQPDHGELAQHVARSGPSRMQQASKHADQRRAGRVDRKGTPGEGAAHAPRHQARHEVSRRAAEKTAQKDEKRRFEEHRPVTFTPSPHRRVYAGSTMAVAYRARLFQRGGAV